MADFPSIEQIEKDLAGSELPSVDQIERDLGLSIPSPEQIERDLRPKRPDSEIIARRRQLEKERSLLLEQEQMQTETDRLSPEKLALRLALGVGSAGGIIEEQVGGVLASPLVARNRRDIGRRLLARGKQRQEGYSELGEGVGGGPVASAAQTLGATGAASAPVLPAAIFGGLPLAAITAGTQQFGATFANARERYLEETKGDVEQAEKKAFGPALLSGLVTGVVTGAFGKTGLEAVSMQAIKAAGIRSVAENLSRMLIGSGKEGIEELTDQALQSIIAKWSYRPELTLQQALEETLQAGGMGIALGGAAEVVVTGTGKAAKKASDVFEDIRADKDFAQRSIVAAQRASQLLADPKFQGDPRFDRVRQRIEKEIITPEVQRAISEQKANEIPVSQQAQTGEAVGGTIRDAEQPAVAGVAQTEAAPIGEGQAVVPAAVAPEAAGATTPAVVPATPAAEAATIPVEAPTQPPLPPVESVSPATAPLEIQEKREKLIAGSDINQSEFEAVETAVARVNGKYDLSATQEAVRHAQHGIPAIMFLRDAAASDDPNTQTVADRANEILSAIPATEKLLNALESLKIESGGLQAFGIVPLVWNGAIDIAKAAVRTGVAIADAVEQAIEWINERHQGTWDEAEARTALTQVLNTPDDTERVRTQIMGGYHEIFNREQLTPDTREESITYAGQLLQELGVTAQLEQEPDLRRGNMVISYWRFTGQNESEAGQRLVQRLRQEISTQNEPGKSPELLASLINSIRLNFERGMDQVFDRPVREQLYSLAQGEASHRGAMLGALAGHSVDLTFVARNVDVVLHRAYSEAFGGEEIESLMRRIADLEAADPQRESDPKGARKRAVKKGRETLTKKEKAAIGSKKRRWKKIEKVLLEGGDLGAVLRTLAEENGWNPPSDSEVDKLKTLADREEALRTLNSKEQAEAASFGDQTRVLREKEAATLSDRVALKREMATRWARLSKPIRFWGPRSLWETKQNLAAALNELAAANLLTKLSFPTRQVISVFSQALVHMPTRAIASALMERQAAVQRGDPAGVKQLWADIADSLRVSVKAQANAVKPALLKARAALLGRAEVKNIDALMSGMQALDRIELRGKELQAQGKNAQAMILWLYTQIKWGYRIAQTLDYLSGTPAEAQELALQVHRELSEHGTNRAQRMMMVDEVIGRPAREMAAAAATVQRILDANDITATPKEIQERAASLVQRWQMERARAFGVPVDDFEAEATMLRNVLGWNERVTRGPGGLIASTGKGLQKIAGEAGLPLPLAAFSNAIGTQVNRLLHFLPIYKLANAKLPFTSEAPDPWFRTETDRQQRMVEALLGTIIGTPLIIMAATGLIVVHTRPPLDREDRELWEKEGHKANTVEIPTGDGSFIPISLNTGPLAPLAPYLAAGGAVHKLMTERGKAQDKLNAEALEKGVPAGNIRPIDFADLMGVAASAAYGSLIGGGRTASGLAGSISEFGQLNAQKGLASQISPLVPGLPMLQEFSRMGGVVLDQKMASFWDFMLPLPTSGARKVNLLGDPVGTPNDAQRVIQIMTGGTFPGLVSAEEARSSPAYEALFASGYRPPTISPNKGFNIGGTFRPMTDSELIDYTRERGERLREGLIPLGATADLKSVQEVYQRANNQALKAVGATVAEPETRSSGLSAGISLGSSRASVRPPARFRVSRGRRMRRPRLARGRLGRVRTTRLRRSRGIRRLSRGLRA